MKTVKELLTEISTVTRNIETNYPEVYEHLDEIPSTIPSEKNPEISTKELEDYLESLIAIITKYKEEHQ
ncbi:hypothetical protein [Bizionia myxarmorum]|uniref:Uncharacterized protein n=1 Tax=Bizionia myxarmorum TaxID=291186 RepID=A0A5D0RD40_9FLAO|nr:hypothetical protein [Bizionia myxarmorum]TYB78725.1 hypothetical protein ES674_02805 [Bizionia myxarmorum]